MPIQHESTVYVYMTWKLHTNTLSSKELICFRGEFQVSRDVDVSTIWHEWKLHICKTLFARGNYISLWKICISRTADKICVLLNLSQNPKWFLIILSAAKRQRRRQRTSRPTWMSWGSAAITCASSRIFVILMIESPTWSLDLIITFQQN